MDEPFCSLVQQTFLAVLLPYLSPLGWEHINLTGDYVWRQSQKLPAGKFRPLRPVPETEPPTPRASQCTSRDIEPEAIRGPDMVPPSEYYAPQRVGDRRPAR
jgi:hypothetical protein